MKTKKEPDRESCRRIYGEKYPPFVTRLLVFLLGIIIGIFAV